MVYFRLIIEGTAVYEIDDECEKLRMGQEGSRGCPCRGSVRTDGSGQGRRDESGRGGK